MNENSLFICYADLFPQENVFDDVRVNGEWAVLDLSERVSNKEMLQRICALVEESEFGKYYLLLNPQKGITLRDFYVKEMLKMMNVHFIIYYPPYCHTNLRECFLRRKFFTGQQVVVSDERELALVRQYIGKGNVELR